MRRTPLLLLLGLVACSFSSGCALAPLLTDQVEFEDANGDDTWDLEPKEDGSIELESAAGRELAEYDVRTDGIAFKDQQSVKFLISDTENRNGLVVRNRETAEVVFKFLREPDLDWKLEDPSGTNLQEVKKKKDYPYKIEGGPQGEQKVKIKDDEIILRDSGGKTILTTDPDFPPLAMACFGLDTVSVEMRAGLALAVIFFEYAPYARP